MASSDSASCSSTANWDVAATSRCAGDILDSARHLLQLINDVLDLSKWRPAAWSSIRTLRRGNAGARSPRCHPSLAEKKGLRLSLQIPASLSANIDPGRFKQVLYNYLSNAVKFTRRVDA